MRHLDTIIYPGFWLSVWQYGVLTMFWFMLIRPSAMFLAPRSIAEAALGYVVLGMMIGTVVAAVLPVDGVLYASTMSTSWIRRATTVIVSAVLGGSVFAAVYACGFSYGANSDVPSVQRWAWAAFYLLSVLMLLFVHVCAIWTYRTAAERINRSVGS